MEHGGERHSGGWIACGAGFWIFVGFMVVGVGLLGGFPLSWLVIGLAVLVGLRWWGGNNIRQGYYGGRHRAYRVLRERFANGEIDQEEYEARKGVLFE